MFDQNYKNIKIIDLARTIQLQPGTEGKYKSDLSGNPRYFSPEKLRNGFCTYSNDIWQFGCVMFEFCNGTPPFSELSDHEC